MSAGQPHQGCGELLRRHDWSASSLGPIDGWPPALRTSVDIVIHSPVAMVLIWGPDQVMIYNDRYAELAGARHPEALGGAVADVWPEMRDWSPGWLEAGWRGESGRQRHVMLPLAPGGAARQIWIDLSCTPLRDALGAVGGVLCTVVASTAVDSTVADATLVDSNHGRLGEDRALLRAVLAQSPNFLALLRGPDHVFEMANEAYLRLAGHRELIGKPLRLGAPELSADTLALLDRVYRSGVALAGRQLTVNLAADLLAPDGAAPAPRQIEFVYQPVKDDAGCVSGILVEGVDITDRMDATERLGLAQQAGGIGSFEWFPHSGEMVVSNMFRRIWGLSDEQPVTAGLLTALVDQRDATKVGPARLHHSDNPLAYVEYRVRRPDNGEVRWIARQGEVVAGRAPGQRRYVGVSFDITERKLIEQALRASQDRLAAIFGQASVGLSELGLDGSFQRVNGALCAMLGRGADELLNLNMNDILHPADVAGNNLMFQRLISSGASYAIEKRYLKPDGLYVWVSSNVSLLVDEHGRPQALISVKTDITERRRVERALRDLNDTLEHRVEQEVLERTKAEDALRQAQKMEAVGQLTGGIAHDFNNVLQIISGNLHLLAPLARQDGSSRQRLETAIAAVERGAKLSSHLLAFARRQPLQPVVSNLARIVRNMDGLLRRALGEAVELTHIGGGGLWNTLVDRSQIENVILNLAINARDAMDGVGKLTIELGNVVLDEQYVQNLVDLPPGQYVMLSVTDTGRGMSGEVLQRAFEPFFTTKPEGEGTGLGLSMAYGFVTQSRGHIRIYSEPGVGTGVKIYLPRSLMAEVDDTPLADGLVTGGSETILVVEDDAGVRSTVVDMLGALGYTVLKAEDGASALMVLQSGVAIDLLFTDVIMPGPVRSPDLARRAQELLPDIAVLFTSGYAQNAIVHGGRLDEGVELLSKPYRREELAHKLRQVLGHRQQRMQVQLRQAQQAQQAQQPRQPAPAMPDLGMTGQPAHAGAAPASLKILVVEDNLDSQMMVCELIGMLGHTVTGVSDGEAAWELMRQGQHFDILFTDVSLPGMSGIALARLVARDKPGTRIIFSTGYGKESMDELGFTSRVLRKPYDLMELKAALDDD